MRERVCVRERLSKHDCVNSGGGGGGNINIYKFKKERESE